MTFRTDGRGRVPFALVGVILLVTSATYTGILATRDPGAGTPDTASALREAQANGRTVLAGALERAARRAVASPVIEPADTELGAALDPTTPFRDALRLRFYVTARRSLAAVSHTVDGAKVSLSLPAIGDGIEARAAIRRVAVTEVDGGRSLVVRIRNITATVARQDRILAHREYNAKVPVGVPALTMHRAVEAYETSLSGPTPTRFESRVTRTLVALTWARGYAQYAGAPIENVLANRHLGLLANRALLAEQRATLGHWDRAGIALLGDRVATVARRDLVVGATLGAESMVQQRSPGSHGNPIEALPPLAPSTENRKVVVGVNGSAAAAKRALIANHRRGLRGLIAEANRSSQGPVSDAAITAGRDLLADLVARTANVSVVTGARSTLGNGTTSLLIDRVQDLNRSVTFSDGALGATTKSAIATAYFGAVRGQLDRRRGLVTTLRQRIRQRTGATRRALGSLTATPALVDPMNGSTVPPLITGINASPAYLGHEAPANGSAPLGVANVNWFAAPSTDLSADLANATGADRAAVAPIAALFEDGIDRILGTLERAWRKRGYVVVPAGLPLLPVPGSWYATVNGWDVHLRGGYDRFAVTAPADGLYPAPVTRYVREKAPVSVDRGGDTGETVIGRNTEIGFEVHTSVVVVVPAGPRGVGDRTERSERSPALRETGGGNSSGPGG